MRITKAQPGKAQIVAVSAITRSLVVATLCLLPLELGAQPSLRLADSTPTAANVVSCDLSPNADLLLMITRDATSPTTESRVLAYDAASFQLLETIDLGEGFATGLQFSESGLLALVAVSTCGGTVCTAGANRVEVIDTDASSPTYLEVVTTTPTTGSSGFGPASLTLTSGGRLFVPDRGADLVYVLDPPYTSVLMSIPAPGAPIGVTLSPNQQLAYVFGRSSTDCIVIDTVALTTTSFPIAGTTSTSSGTVGAAAHPSEPLLYHYRSMQSDQIFVIDTSASNQVTATISVPATCLRSAEITEDGRFLTVLDVDASTLLIVDVDPVSPTLHEVVDTLCLPGAGAAFTVEGLPTRPGFVATANLDRVTRITAGDREEFRRGDCNADGAIQISDAIFELAFLFGGGSVPTCDDACDNNDDGQVDISDVVYLLEFLFTSGRRPVVPGLSCGVDPSVDFLCCMDGVCP